MSFTTEEVELLLQMARDSALGRTFPDRLGALTEAIASLVPATSMSAFVIDPSTREGSPVTNAFFRNGTLETLRDYSEHYMALDPMTPLVNPADGLPRLLSDTVRGRAFGRDAFTGEFLPRLGVRHLLGFSHRMPDGRLLSIAVQRERGLGDFTERERALIRLASPDVARAVSGVLLLAKVDAIAKDANGLDASSGGLIFTKQGDLAHADPGAARLLRRLEESGLTPEALAAEVRSVAARPEEGTVVERTLPLRGGGRLRVRLSSTPADQVLAIIEVVPVGSREHFETVSDRAGLTTREREVASLAIQGLGNRQIARRLGTAEVTVNFHLRNVYAKTGAHGRHELTTLLLGGGAAP